MKHILAIVFFLSWITPLGAADMAPSKDLVPPASAPAASILSPCPAPDRLSQVSQADCCKGHKGVCGCRAGKIVCCDNTTSANCACHGDSGVEN
jgi:hypothetical protein